MKGKTTMDVEKLKQATGLSALYYKVPQHANTIWYSFGGVTLFCFLAAMGSGIIMAQFYSPSSATAYASVKYISSTPGIQLIRGIHYWSANLGFLMLIIHMLRIMITGAFRPPRIINYFVGLGLLLIIFLIYFTGTMLSEQAVRPNRRIFPGRLYLVHLYDFADICAAYQCVSNYFSRNYRAACFLY
jgi:ubiquinol-cytochrome c reductase cytochrome b subunit